MLQFKLEKIHLLIPSNYCCFVFVWQVLESPRAGQRKMWVCVKSTGELIEINLDRDRPISFDCKESEIQWDRASALNALKFNAAVKSGRVLQIAGVAGWIIACHKQLANAKFVIICLSMLNYQK